MKLKELLDVFYAGPDKVVYYVKARKDDFGLEKIHRYSFLSDYLEDKEVKCASIDNNGKLTIHLNLNSKEKEFNPDEDDF